MWLRTSGGGDAEDAVYFLKKYQKQLPPAQQAESRYKREGGHTVERP